MSFLQFFGYYILCFILVQSVLLGLYYMKITRNQKKYGNLLQKLDLDENHPSFEEQEKKTWN